MKSGKPLKRLSICRALQFNNIAARDRFLKGEPILASALHANEESLILLGAEYAAKDADCD